MKVLFSFLVFIIYTAGCISQINTITVCRNNLNKVIPSNSPVYDTINVTIPNSISVLDVNVKIDTVLCTWDAVLQFRLSHLSVVDTLILYRGGSGDNFIGTKLNDSALIPVSSGIAPFTGTYRPDGPLSKFITQSPNGSWVLRISADSGGDTGLLKAWCLEIQYDYVTGVNNNGTVPDKFLLYQNYPNPFNPVTSISFDIPGGSFVKLTVSDLLGREVGVPAEGYYNPGNYKVDFNASELPSGLYFYKLTTGTFTDVKKMVLIK